MAKSANFVTHNGVRLALGILVLLVISVACAPAAEPTTVPRPTAAPAPTFTPIPTFTPVPGAPTVPPVAVAIPTPTPLRAAPTVAPAQVRPTHWTWGIAEDPTVNMDPLQPGGSSGGAGRARTLVLDSLMQYEGVGFKLENILTERWEFVTPTHVRFNLRKNIKFHDGTPFTAEDVEYKVLGLINDPKLSGSAALKAEVRSVEVVDQYTVDLKLVRPLGPIVGVIMGATSGIVSKAYRERVGPKVFKVKPMGTGPYKVVSIEDGQKVDFEAVGQHWMGPVFPPRLTLFWVREGSTRTAALLAGTVDAIESVDHEQIPRLERDPKVKPILVAKQKSRWHTYYGAPPLDNENLRKALNYALDKEAIVKDLLEGRAEIMASTLIKGNIGYDPDLKPYPYDPAKATSLIKAAGLSGASFELLSVSGTYPRDRDIAILAVSLWEAVGLKPKVRFVTRELWFDYRTAGTFQICYCGQWGEGPEVDGEINWDYRDPGQQGGRPLFATPLGAEVDKLWQEQRGTVDLAKREQLLKAIDKFVYDHALTVYTHAFNRYIAVNKALDYQFVSDSSFPYYPIHYDRLLMRGLK